MPAPVPLTVLIPTLGRQTLTACLESIAAGDAQPAELLLVDQGEPGEASARAEAVGLERLRLLRSGGSGTAVAVNEGLHAACHDSVLVTHDDCQVDRAWVRTAWELASRDPLTLVTGRVKPLGPADAVPSTKDEPTARDYTGQTLNDVLYPNNALLNRKLALDLGGFDSALSVAEDNDFCYRWLRAGHRLRYEPDLVVWHAHWRSRAELASVYRSYGRSQGLFYAKHLRHGDRAMLRFLARDARAILHWIGERARGRAPDADYRAGLLRGLPRGLAEGLIRPRRPGA